MALLAKKNGIVSTWPMPINRSRGFDHARNDEGQCREQAEPSAMMATTPIMCSGLRSIPTPINNANR